MAKYKTSSDPDTKKIFENGILSRNPVLVYAIGICPLIAVAKSAATACVLAILSAILLIALEVLTSLILKKMPKWLRVGVYALLGVLIIIPFYMLMNAYMPSIEVSLGIYIPLLAVNSLNVQRCEAFAVKHSVKYAFFDAVANSIGYAIPLILTGILREALGSSRIFGYYIDALPQANGFLMPFCGFIILGFVAAFINFMRNKFRIGEEFDARGNDFVLDKQKDKELYNDEDEDSLQNEITVVPENIQDTASAAVPEVKATEVPAESELSASFESSVSRIMHKWASESDSEISPEINVQEEKTGTFEQAEVTDTKAAAVPDISAATVTEQPVVSTEAAETPIPKKATRKRTTKKTSETIAETTDSGVSSADTVAPVATEAASAESSEAPVPKKTTRKRTTKKTAESTDSSASTADTVATVATEAASAESSEAPAPKKTTRKRTTKKAAEATDSGVSSADTVATVATEAASAESSEAPAPKKTTRKRTTKKAAETTDSSASTADTVAAVAAEAASAESSEAPAPKKTTRKRTTKKAAETTDSSASTADTVAAVAAEAASAESSEAPAPKKTTRKRTTKKAAETKADTADSSVPATDTAAAVATEAASTEITEAPAPKKTTRKRTTKKAAEVNAETADATTAEDAGQAPVSSETSAPKKTTRKRTAKKTTETAEPTQETMPKED